MVTTTSDWKILKVKEEIVQSQSHSSTNGAATDPRAVSDLAIGIPKAAFTVLWWNINRMLRGPRVEETICCGVDRPHPGNKHHWVVPALSQEKQRLLNSLDADANRSGTQGGGRIFEAAATVNLNYFGTKTLESDVLELHIGVKQILGPASSVKAGDAAIPPNDSTQGIVETMERMNLTQM
ncbi:unnamed protein product [Sympodiomycopsis kandeliae]